jgi:hypothetical protein
MAGEATPCASLVVVIAVTPGRGGGSELGMTLVEALTSCPGLYLSAHDPDHPPYSYPEWQLRVLPAGDKREYEQNDEDDGQRSAEAHERHRFHQLAKPVGSCGHLPSRDS